MIIFTFRELKSAWWQAWTAYDAPNRKTNAHRLLLFYAVETGLKAVLLKDKAKTDSENLEDFFVGSDGKKKSGHDLNNLMDYLKAGKELRLKTEISLDALKQPVRQRKLSCSDLNQVWRYGAKAKNPSDAELETQLLEIQEWIEGRLR